MYAKLLAGLDGIRDRAIFLIACFCALRPSELFGLTWGCYTGNVFTIVNTAWRGRLQRKKIKRKNRYGRTNYRLVAIPHAVRNAIDLWRARCPNTDASPHVPRNASSGAQAAATPIHPDNWLRLRLYPVAKDWECAFHPTFQVLRRSFSTHGKKEAHPTEMQAQLGHSDIRTTLDIYTQITDPEVARMVNQVTNRILGLDEEAEPGYSVRWAGNPKPTSFPDKIKMKLRGRGEMAEWLKARASKACIPLRVSGVRIPLSPPFLGWISSTNSRPSAIASSGTLFSIIASSASRSSPRVIS